MLQRRANGLIETASPSSTDPARPLPGSPIAKAHAEFVMALAARKPSPIALEPEPEDFTARAILCEEVIERVRGHLTILIEDAAENDAEHHIRDADLTASIDAHLGDLASDITGTLEQVAERLREERYDGCPPGPFHRRR